MESHRQVLMDASTMDELFCAEILYAIDIQAQRWVSQCRDAKGDRSTVDDDIVDFSDIMEQVLNGNFDRKLPPTFSLRSSTSTSELIEDVERPPSKRNKKSGGDGQKPDSIKNPKQCDKFKMRTDEDWSIFKNKKTLKWIPEWDEKSKMCPRWHSRGDCFKDCNNAASHVPCHEIPAEKKTSYCNYLKRLRKED